MSLPELVRESFDESIVKNFFEENQFFLVYQKKVSLNANNEVVGLEAFLRLRQENGESLSAGAVLPIVERMGLLPELSLLVITQVTEQWDYLLENNLECTVAVNIDVCVFENSKTLSAMIAILKESNMPPHRLAIDIVLKAGEAISDKAVRGLNKFRMVGANLSLDILSDQQVDFDLIEGLPIDEIKFGRALICNILDSDSCRNSIRNYLSTARKVGLSVTAVGIENVEELRWLEKFGVDYGQGFLYGEPEEVEMINFYTNVSDESLLEERSHTRLKLLVVEDDADYGRLMMDILSDHYEFYLTDNETEALEIIDKEMPEILILDIHLRSGNGFNIANSIRQKYDDALFSIIFVSGEDSQENRISSYESGGVAFIAKPVPVVDLITKINRYAAMHRKRREQVKRISDSESMAFQSMREASHYGEIIQFMKEISQRREEPGIAKSLFSYMGNRGHNCAIVFRDGDDIHSFDQSGLVCNPIELNVFELLASKGRLYEFGQRLMVSDKHISFLVKNMPDSDVEKGQVRDYVAVLIECMESRYVTLLQNRVLEVVVGDLGALAREAASSIEDSEQSNQAMVDKFSMEIGLSFHVLDLTVEQEDHLKGIVSDAIHAKDDGNISTDDIVDRIQSSVNRLSSTLEEISELGAEVIDDDDAGESVELF